MAGLPPDAARLRVRGAPATRTRRLPAHARRPSHPRRGPLEPPAGGPGRSHVIPEPGSRAVIAIPATAPAGALEEDGVTRDCSGRCGSSRVPRAEHGLDIVCELLAVWGESEACAGGVAEQPGAGGGFELGDLGGESFVLGAEVAGGPGQTRVSRGREEPADALVSAGPGEGSPDGWREVIRPAQGGEGVGVAVDAVPDRDAGAAGQGGEVGDRDAGFSRDVLQAPAVCLVLLAQPSRVDLPRAIFALRHQTDSREQP